MRRVLAPTVENQEGRLSFRVDKFVVGENTINDRLHAIILFLLVFSEGYESSDGSNSE